MKARDFLLCAVAVPVLYLLFLLMGLAWDAAVAVVEFFAATPTNPASFTFVCFVLTVLAGGCAVTAFREVEESRPSYIGTWKYWRVSQYDNLRWYAVALVGMLFGALQLYMLFTMPARPDANTFRAWVSIVGLTARFGCFLVVPLNLGSTLWMLWRDRSTPAV